MDELTVQDNSTITVTERMEGNPWTSLLSQWSHQHWSMYNHGVQLYPYIYEATYQYQQIDRSFCGRSLFFEAMNSNGKSERRETVVLVLCKYCLISRATRDTTRVGRSHCSYAWQLPKQVHFGELGIEEYPPTITMERYAEDHFQRMGHLTRNMATWGFGSYR